MKSPVQVLEIVNAAQSVVAQLQTRISSENNALDLGDLVYLQTTIKQIQEVYRSAAEYEEHLSRHLGRTCNRIAQLSQ